MTEISMYRNVFDAVPAKNRNIKDYVLAHKDKWLKHRNTITEIRSLDPLIDKQKYDQLKRVLPGATVSGVFLKRNSESLLEHSGYICIDIDRKEKINSMLNTTLGRNELKDKLKQEPWVYAIILSAGGLGLAVIVKISTDKHLESYKSLESYFLETYSVTTDDACTDISRFRYISYDPDVYLNEDAVEYECEDSFNFGTNEKTNGKYFTIGNRDKDSFSVANSLIKTGLGKEFAEKVLDLISKDWDDKISNFAKIKVASAMKRHSDNLTNDIKEWVLSSHGVFLSSTIDMDLGLSSSVVKKNRSKILSRLVDEEIIERVGKKNGQFRLIDNTLNETDWRNAAIDDYYDLKMPLGLDKLMYFYPKNIMVIAGSPNAGKTSFVLNVVKMNNDKEIHYFNSEMGPEELRQRLYGFEDLTENAWNHVMFYDRNNNFADVIKPDALNIVDFLEITDSFYQIADEIRKIHDKLNKGVCIICLQKKKGSEMGRGAEFSLEKPRVYLSLDFQSLKIVKCKNPKVHNVDVNGKEISFKLINGSTFMEAE